MNSPNFKVYSTIYISVPVRIKWEKWWTLTNKTSIPLYEFSGSSHAVKSNFVAISRGIQNTKRKLSLSINRISYKPLRLIGCCEHQWFSQKMTIKGHNFLVFPKMSSPKIATKRHNFKVCSQMSSYQISIDYSIFIRVLKSFLQHMERN